jgi:hypothetical protein
VPSPAAGGSGSAGFSVATGSGSSVAGGSVGSGPQATNTSDRTTNMLNILQSFLFTNIHFPPLCVYLATFLTCHRNEMKKLSMLSPPQN